MESDGSVERRKGSARELRFTGLMQHRRGKEGSDVERLVFIVRS